MGLRITAWKRVELVQAQTIEQHLAGSGDPPNGTWFLYPFPGQGEFSTRADDLKAGYYRCSNDASEQLSFSIGSYHNYDHWRQMLARLVLDQDCETIWANLDRFRNQPFYELINFGDNEGIIGPRTAGKLALDFVANQERANAAEPWFREIYNGFRLAFELAASEGAGVVKFH